MMSDEVLLAVSTFPDAETAKTIAEQLVAARVTACANISAPMQSIYWWKEKIESAAEVMVLFKTTRSRFSEFQSALKALHPYDVPEIICLEISGGSAEYLRWVEQSCAASATL